MSAATKIRSFAYLPNGWNYGRGGPIGSEMIQDALSILELLQTKGFPAYDAFPGTDGEIMICAYNGPKRSVEVTLEIDGIHEFESTRGDDGYGVSGLELNELKEYLIKLDC